MRLAELNFHSYHKFIYNVGSVRSGIGIRNDPAEYPRGYNYTILADGPRLVD